MVNLHKSKQPIVLIALGLYASLFFLQKTNLMASDLGRHLKNGELLVNTKQPITTNLYSYTYPAYPFIAHHWGFGVVAYSVYNLAGFNGLTIVNAAIFFLTVVLLLSYSAHRVGLRYTMLGFFLTLPLLTYRTEIRPETISTLFIIITLLIITSTHQTLTKLVALSLLQVAWVNIHVFFVFGLFLTATYLLTQLIRKAYRPACATLGILIAQTLASLINPYGLQGALYPLHIFADYGYRIVENQTPFLLLNILPSPIYYYLLGIGVVTALLTVLTIKTVLKEKLFIWLVTVMFLAGSLKMVRLMPYFGLFALVFLSCCFSALYQRHGATAKHFLTKPLLLVILGELGATAAVILMASNLYNPFNNFGLGLMPEISKSAEFFKANSLQGPVFNNYDSGGYLIFYLYPNQKVFVDNRPEAYPSSFFKEKYVPMQENEAIWAKVSSDYGFNTIYFYRHDYTPWAQPFLINRLKDPTWAPVFVDNYALILVKRNLVNTAVIKAHELPKELFSY